VREAELAGSLGYQAGLLSLGGWRTAPEAAIVRHCVRVARTLPLIGVYLQPLVGGRVLSHRFWREFAEIPNVVAIKFAPLNRDQTLDVVRAVIASERTDIAFYTGNDDNIIADLLTPFGSPQQPRYIAGGLLGQWGGWTERAGPCCVRSSRCGPTGI
jgi:dihydrodipicolinate synthase/N-acetylneuraminate lyase